MAKAKGVGDILTGILFSTGKSLVTSELKKQAKGFLGARFAKTPAQAKAEAAKMLGYETEHFILDKKDNVTFKSSAIFVHEWLCNSPYTSKKIMKDQENGQIFFDGKPLTNSVKVDLITKFTKATGICSPSVKGHFENAYELLDFSDFTSLKFAKEFEGWNPENESVIDTFLPRAFGTALAEEDVPAASKLFRKWIIGTAQRALEPGSSHDGCFVFQGPAGVGKTRFFRELLPEPFDNRTGEIMCDIKSPQKLVESIVGKTIACFDELSVLEYPKTQETFKQILTSQFIDVRMVWARKPQRYALRQGFSATTNKKKFIPEKSLRRRLWVVKLNDSQRLDFDFLHQHRKALWQEAVYLVKKGESGILTYDEQKQLEEANKQFEENQE